MSTMHTKGSAFWQNGAPLAGGRVEIWDGDPVHDDLLGVSIIDPSGRYDVAHPRSREIYARVFDHQGICRYFSFVHNKCCSDILPLNFSIQCGRLAANGVAGRIRWTSGDTARMCLAELIEVDNVSSEDCLGAAVVNDSGWYAIPVFRRGRYRVRATDPDGNVCRFVSYSNVRTTQNCLDILATVDPTFEVFKVFRRGRRQDPEEVGEGSTTPQGILVDFGRDGQANGSGAAVEIDGAPCRLQTAAPDLRPDEIVFDPPNPKPDEGFEVSCNVWNIGNTRSGPFRVFMIRKQTMDAEPDDPDDPLGEVVQTLECSHLRSGQATVISHRQRGLAKGTYEFSVHVDAAHFVAQDGRVIAVESGLVEELDEDNSTC